jgi:hypothetical protein
MSIDAGLRADIKDGEHSVDPGRAGSHNGA